MNENEYTAFRVRENGRDQSFQLDRRESFLDIAKFLRSYLTHEWPSGPAALEKSFAGLEPVSAEQYGQLMELHLEDPNKVTGVYELDFDKREVSTVGMGRSWQTWSMKGISSAVDLDDLCRAELISKESRWRENGSLTSNLYRLL